MATISDPFPAGWTTEREITQFEEHIGHRLPNDYRRFLLEHNGGRPEPDALTITIDGIEEEGVVMCFFPMRDLSIGNIEVNNLEELRTWPMHCAWNDLQSDLANLYEIEMEESLLPIGTDGSGNYYCIVLDGNRTGSILFFDHEMAETVLLAHNLKNFLESLRPRERNDDK